MPEDRQVRRDEPGPLSWGQAVVVIVGLSALAWLVVIAVAVAVWSLF
jgi:hypothetical protein